jgi:hypothetical protein
VSVDPIIFIEEVAMDVIASTATEQLSRALGEAVVRIWSHLPHDVQHHLFEEASFQGEGMRPQLALFLHEKHSRTSAAIKARAMLESDSLRG